MTTHLSLGAIKKSTGEYVPPKMANKADVHCCPTCNKDVIVCQGDIRKPYYRHRVDTNPCQYYCSPTESQIHKDAKSLLKILFESRIPIVFTRTCPCCQVVEEYEIPELTESSSIVLEYRLEYNGPKVADVAYLDNGEIVAIFEICHTHRTDRENRPEPWFELDATGLIQQANESSSVETIYLSCIRKETCEECLEIEESNLQAERLSEENTKKLQHKEAEDLVIISNNVDRYIRAKLGQTLPPPISGALCNRHFTSDLWAGKVDNCELCIYDKWLRTPSSQTGILNEYDHPLHFDFKGNYLHNKMIIDLFKENFYDKEIVIKSVVIEGEPSLLAYIVSKNDYDRYDYFGPAINNDLDLELPYEKRIYYSYKREEEILENELRADKRKAVARREGESEAWQKYPDIEDRNERIGTISIIKDIFEKCKKIHDKRTQIWKFGGRPPHDVYLQVPFYKKDFIKNYGGRWDKNSRLWYMNSYDYKSNKKIITEQFGEEIIWDFCYRCEGTHRYKEGPCWFC